MATNKRRIKTAIARLDSIERHLNFLMNDKKGFNKKAIKWNIDQVLYDTKTARTLLKNMIKDENKNWENIRNEIVKKVLK